MSLINAIRNGNVALVSTLLENDDVDIYQADNSGNPPLYMACWYGYEEIVKLLLNKDSSSAHIDQRSHGGGTPLMAASMMGHIGVIQLLLQYGVFIDQQDDIGETAIDYACIYCIDPYGARSRKIVDLLLNFRDEGTKRAKPST